MSVLQGQSEAVSEQLNEEEQLLVISRLHQVSQQAESVTPCSSRDAAVTSVAVCIQ